MPLVARKGVQLMERLTFEASFCDIALCDSEPDVCGICDQRKVWERLKAYEDAEEQGRLMELPCKIGDEVWGIRCYRGVKHPQKGRVSEMYYRQDMSLLISVKHICRGLWGKTVFPTYEAAEASLKGGKRE